MPSIYLSPSLQEYNPYINGGNEEEMMNRIADAMMPYLKASGIQVVRNNPEQSLTNVINQSNAGNFDLHVALHSNASPENMSGQLQGTDIYYRPGNWRSYRLAELLVENFKNIYPYPQMVEARPSSYLAEVLRTTAPAVLIEVAYHDNWEDAQWIKENIETIARAVSLSITEYFGVPLLEPQPEQSGRVTTTGAPLLLRSRPNTGAPILARMPNGTPITIYGVTPSYWYVVGYGDKVGYASGNYITIE